MAMAMVPCMVMVTSQTPFLSCFMFDVLYCAVLLYVCTKSYDWQPNFPPQGAQVCVSCFIFYVEYCILRRALIFDIL